MPNKGWKSFERNAATMIGGARYWSNSGEKVDVQGPHFVGQCKNVGRLSLPEATSLALEIEKEAKKRQSGSWLLGLLFVRKKRSKITLVIMTEKTFRELRLRAEQGDPT